ncbi:MAG: isopeptide-forming domain-containing fimbrial protein [Oscillospiraceae bacterium]|nr:isopeptide-forming domain-containing fimbrial protein [Oscillospiraceae bacterium]
MKRVCKLLLCVALLLHLGLVASASQDTDTAYDTANGGFRIEIANAIAGETYEAYKIFDVSYANDSTPAPEPDDPDATALHSTYSYTVSPASPWWAVVTEGANPALSAEPASFTAQGLQYTRTVARDGDDFRYVVAAADGFDAAVFAGYLHEHIPPDAPCQQGAASARALQTEADSERNVRRGTAVIDGLNPGYYFVTTTAGALCALDTTEPVARIVEKNIVPDLSKQVSDRVDSGFGEQIDLGVGDIAYFKIEITTGAGNDSDITLHDSMGAGLTLNRKDSDGTDATFTVADKNGAVDPACYAVTYDAVHTTGEAPDTLTTTCSFDIRFQADYITALGDNETVTIRYDATLGADAVLYDEANLNTARIDYAHQSSLEKTVRVYTYRFDMVKLDFLGALLPGAEFTLTRRGEDAPIPFVKTADGYRAAQAGEPDTTTILASPDGRYRLFGLDASIYILTETKAPGGYNPLDGPVMVILRGTTDGESQGHIFDGNGAAWTATPYRDDAGSETPTVETLADTVAVVNLSGTMLPSTGGIGTSVFYILGGVLVLVAAVVLIVRLRMHMGD